MNSPALVVGYLALFSGVGLAFVFVNLLLGRFLRPHAPNFEKLEVYECGEPTIGSSFVQFDLRFYVVALLFIIFDVEVAFFFPWATVYGKATQLLDPQLVVASAAAEPGVPRTPTAAPALPESNLTPAQKDLYRELGVPEAAMPDDQQAVGETARALAVVSMLDISVFFAVLLVGFAYVWKRGDLDWVRAISREHAAPEPMTGDALEEPALTA